MANLTKTAVTTRKVIRYGFFGIIAIVVGRLLLIAGFGVYRQFFPAPVEPPTVAFGKLPEIAFPEGQASTDINFALETPDGEFPTLPDRQTVYFMPQPVANLLALDVATAKANSLGFLSEPIRLSETNYRFDNLKLPSNVVINTVTGEFSTSYDLGVDPAPLEIKPRNTEILIATVKSFISAANLLPEDLQGPTKVDFLKITDGKLSTVLSLSEADLVKVNLFRNDVNGIPSLTLNPEEANVWFIVAGSNQRNKAIIAGEYHYFPLDLDQSATYPIKTAKTAWEELVAGKAFVAKPAGNTVTIRRIYLAYLDTGSPTEFYQPVIVFEGDNGFTAYVPAVTSEYYGE